MPHDAGGERKTLECVENMPECLENRLECLEQSGSSTEDSDSSSDSGPTATPLTVHRQATTVFAAACKTFRMKVRARIFPVTEAAKIAPVSCSLTFKASAGLVVVNVFLCVLLAEAFATPFGCAFDLRLAPRQLVAAFSILGVLTPLMVVLNVVRCF